MNTSKLTVKKSHRGLIHFTRSQKGFAVVEKALIVFLSLGLVIFVGSGLSKATQKKTDSIAVLMGGK